MFFQAFLFVWLIHNWFYHPRAWSESPSEKLFIEWIRLELIIPCTTMVSSVCYMMFVVLSKLYPDYLAANHYLVSNQRGNKDFIAKNTFWLNILTVLFSNIIFAIYMEDGE